MQSFHTEHIEQTEKYILVAVSKGKEEEAGAADKKEEKK